MSSKFVVSKGTSNEFVITIKQNGTTLPMVIESTDTFVAKLLTLCGGEVVTTLTTSVINAQNGKIKLTLPDSVVTGLKTEKGDRADYCYSKPLYKLVIDCNTVNNGKFVAKINKVYVE